jgi:hypothetical protein
VFLLGALLELNVCLLLASREAALKGLMVGLLGIEFLAYHAMLWLLHYPGPCHCLGAFFQWASVPDEWMTALSVILACYLTLAGSLMACFSRDETRLSPKHG